MVAAVLPDHQSAGVVVDLHCAEGRQAVSLEESAAHRNGVSVASDDPEVAHRICDRLTLQVISTPDRIGQVYTGDTQAVAGTTETVGA